MSGFKYVPFLKAKANEISAFTKLENDVVDLVRPFFDVPRKQDPKKNTESVLINDFLRISRKLKKNLKGKFFYLDDLDIPDGLLFKGFIGYEFLINNLSGQNFIPVVGIDRDQLRNNFVFIAKNDGRITSDEVALRIVLEDCYSFEAVEIEIKKIYQEISNCFSIKTLIIDGRVLGKGQGEEAGSTVGLFILKILNKFKFDNIIFSGSSIPSRISDIVATQSSIDLFREELNAISKIRSLISQKVIFGDYTIVSPYYSDVVIPPEMLRNIMAPKITYSYDKVHYIERGKSMKSYSLGSTPYQALIKNVVSKFFYRGSSYSYGDAWLNLNVVKGNKAVTAGSILAPTISAHMTFMVKSGSFVF